MYVYICVTFVHVLCSFICLYVCKYPHTDKTLTENFISVMCLLFRALHVLVLPTISQRSTYHSKSTTADCFWEIHRASAVSRAASCVVVGESHLAILWVGFLSLLQIGLGCWACLTYVFWWGRHQLVGAQSLLHLCVRTRAHIQTHTHTRARTHTHVHHTTHP